MNEEVRTIEDRLVKLFQGIVSALPAGCATLRVKRAPEIEHDGVSIWLTPSNPQAAEIVADAKNGDSTVSVCVGQRTPIEVLPTRNHTIVDDVREICQAVIDGKLQEELWLVGNDVIKCIAKIELGGKVHVFRYYDGLYPFSKKERKLIHYSPYCLSDP
jgi:hypothetical protein